MTASIIYKGEFRCECTHVRSGSLIETDAPVDNKGKGERFSPTDTVCVALATCMITTMAIKTADTGINLSGTQMEVTKYMLADPRRIGRIDIVLQFPSTLQLEESQKALLKQIGETCPVAESISKDIRVNVDYQW